MFKCAKPSLADRVLLYPIANTEYGRTNNYQTSCSAVLQPAKMF